MDVQCRETRTGEECEERTGNADRSISISISILILILISVSVSICANKHVPRLQPPSLRKMNAFATFIDTRIYKTEEPIGQKTYHGKPSKAKLSQAKPSKKMRHPSSTGVLFFSYLLT